MSIDTSIRHLFICLHQKKAPSALNCIASLPETSKCLKSVLYHLATSVIKPSVGMSALKACQEHLFTNGAIITPDMYTITVQERIVEKRYIEKSEIIAFYFLSFIAGAWCLPPLEHSY